MKSQPIYTNGNWRVYALTSPGVTTFALTGPNFQSASYAVAEIAQMQADANAKGDTFRARVAELISKGVTRDVAYRSAYYEIYLQDSP